MQGLFASFFRSFILFLGVHTEQVPPPWEAMYHPRQLSRLACSASRRLPSARQVCCPRDEAVPAVAGVAC